MKRAGHSAESLADKLKTSPEQVIAWCQGVEVPSYSVLERIAYSHLRIPLATFFLPRPPVIPDPTAKFRRLDQYNVEHISPDTRRLIREAYGYQLSLKELLHDERPSTRLWQRVHTRGVSPSAIATDIRQTLGATIEQQTRLQSHDAAFKWWRHKYETAGIYTFKESFDDICISGFSLLDEEYPVVVVNNSTPFSRQIFTLAHEVAHILVGVDGVTDIDERYMPYLGDDDRRIEVRCNAIAGEILVPSNAFRDDARAYDNRDPDALSSLASKYRVSREVILRKLFEVDAVTQKEFEHQMAEWRRTFHRRGGDASGGNYYLTKLAYLGEGFARLAFASNAAGRTTRIELADHLNVKVRNLDKLQRYLRF